MKFHYLALFVVLVTAAAQKGAVSRNPADDLSTDFYVNTCPHVEDIIQQKVAAWTQNDSTLAPSILRLHFHDCAVRGCDASILLNFTGSEEDSFCQQYSERFPTKGLDVSDLVTLSGAHTIGRASCGTFLNRVNDFNGTRKPDPSLNTHYVQMLKKRCRRSTDLVHLDVRTPTTFDTVYYTNLQRKEGLLTTDQETLSDPRTAASIKAMASQRGLFETQFATAMIKVGNVEVLTRNEGEVRMNCNLLNRP
ncbi:hypothetical protein SLA2020_412250 [Shorea laevis]